MRRWLVAIVAAVLVMIVPVGSLQAQHAHPAVRPAVLSELKGVEVPAGAVWCVTELALQPQDRISQHHGVEFVIVLRGRAEVTAGGQTTSLEMGNATAVAAGVPRSYRGDGRIVSFVLGTRAPSWSAGKVLGAACSEPLTGLRSGPQLARLVRVELSPSAQTPVHTHPGPELLYAPDTPIILQTEGRLRWVMGQELAMVPGDAPVQVRNIGSAEAWFLALFIVAEGAPFQTNLPGF